MSSSIVLSVNKLSFPWQTADPFLFCVHHNDHYPAGNDLLGPKESLAGRRLGMDFDGKDGWSMYHGEVVPGFPRHPHRGFETITIARRGFIDHSDSLGATARFGQGDVQWMTAGRGIVHSEMFPLIRTDESNPTELFQIWLNLPRTDKMVEPHFTMLWSESVGKKIVTSASGENTEVAVIAGELEGLVGPPPPPNSWASRPESAVAIWTLKLAAGASYTLPAGPIDVNRTLYFFSGNDLKVGDRDLVSGVVASLRSEAEVPLVAGETECEVLVLQGRPLGEPVAHHGPFVMNTPAELQQAMNDYRRTQFGGWPWKSDAPVHPREDSRFAVHADGRRETPP